MFRRLLLLLGLIAAAVLVPAAAAQADPPRKSVEIAAIVYNPPGRDAGFNLRNEMLVLVNTGKHPVYLKGYTITDLDKNKYTFRHVVLWRKGDKVVLHTGIGKDTPKHVYWDRFYKDVWDNKGDVAFLRNHKGKLVDHCGYRGTLLGFTLCRS